MAIWYGVVQCLNKKSVLFLRPYGGKRSEARSVLYKRFKSFERPSLQKLISDLTKLKKYNSESIVDYITRAEDMKLNLSEVDKSISEKMFFSILLKGLPREFESFCTLVKYGQDKTLDEIKRDLINFESEKRNDRNTEKSESVFYTNDRTCFNCHQRGHIAKFCRAQPSEPNKEKPNSKITCFKCKKLDILPRTVLLTKNLNPMKNERKNNSKESKNLVSEEQEEESFSFFSSENCVEHQDFIIDSGATNYMIKDKSTFTNLDEKLSGIIHNANKTQSAIIGKGDVEFFAKNSNEELKKMF